MQVQILQQVVDSAGNIGYEQISIQTLQDIPSTVLYLQSLPAGNYMAQVSDINNTTTIIAQVP
jgi:hypothetical protein